MWDCELNFTFKVYIPKMPPFTFKILYLAGFLRNMLSFVTIWQTKFKVTSLRNRFKKTPTFASISPITSPMFCVCIAKLFSSYWKFWNFAVFLGYFSIKLHSVNVSFEPNVLFNITCIAVNKCNDSKRWTKLKLFNNLLRMLFYLYFIAFMIQISRLILFLLRPICCLYF